MEIISADGHIDMPFIWEDIFHKAAPAALKDRVPRYVEGEGWSVRGKPIFRGAGKYPKSKVSDRIRATGFVDDMERGINRPGTAERRIADQKLDGLSGEVIYGLLGLDRSLKDDPEAVRFVFRFYYEWILDFISIAPERFAAIGPLACFDPDQAAEDVRHMARLGLKGIEVKPGHAVKPFWHDIWKPLWEAAEETGLPIQFHSEIGRLLNPATPEDMEDYGTIVNALIGSIGKMANAESLGAMVLSGVLERHPRLILVLGETDISWIPHFLDRMDYMVSEREFDTGLPMLPRDYWYRQCRATFQHDKLGVELLHHVGIDNVMWGNDYPHPDGIWPNSKNILDDHLAGLSEGDKKKILHDNVAALYGF